MAARRLIGVLGGMGPLATVDFMQKVIEATPATRDQDHVPMIVYSVPQIPDRVSAIAAGTDEPFPDLLKGMRVLEAAGAELIAIPCNTAHAWFDRLAASTDREILHIADAVRRAANGHGETIALMATSGTVRAGFYQRYLQSDGRRVIVPDEALQAQISEAIGAVKAAELDRARALVEAAGSALLERGADRLLFACTELPVGARGSSIERHGLDATHCLAKACIAFSTGKAEFSSGVRAPLSSKEADAWTSGGSRTS